MSPSRLNRIDELNYLVKLHDVHYFRTFVESNRVSYRVAMFKAIESGSSTLVDIVRWHHPHPEEADIELECLHAAFRGHLSIYEVIPLNEDMEEFNPYRENMYLFHGQLNRVNLLEMDMHDLLSPNTIPVAVCDAIVRSSSLSSCLATGVLLAYCIHNHEHWSYLEQNQNVFIMDDMFQHALYHKNHKLCSFLISKYKENRQYTKYNYKLRNGSFQKQRRFEGDLTMYDHYLAALTETSVPKIKPVYTINEQNLCLSNEMFEWPGPLIEVDAYFEQVLAHVHQLLDQGAELRHC
jgi:hypothetical protein